MCESQSASDINKNTLPGRDIIRAFVSSGLNPKPTDAEFKSLFQALEIYSDEANDRIYWRKLLSASVDREHTMLKNIFPKSVSDLIKFNCLI